MTSSPAPEQQHRRFPSPPGLAAAAGGILVVLGVGTLVGEVDGDALRAGAFAAGVLLAVGGVALARPLDGWRSAAAAVAIASAGPFLAIGALVINVEALSLRQQVAALAGGVTLLELALFAAGPIRGHLLPLGLALAGAWIVVLSPFVPAPAFPFGFFPLASSITASESPVVQVPSPSPSPSVSVPPVPPPTRPAPPEPPPPPPGFERPEGFEGFRPPEGFEFPEGFEPPEGFEESLRPPSFDAEVESPQFDFESPSPTPLTTFEEGGLSSTGDAVAAGLVSLAFAAAALGAAVALDARRRFALGTPFAAVGDAAAITGLLFLADELSAAGAGLLAIVVGAALAAVAAWTGGGARRFTGWLGVLVAVIGVVAVVTDLLDDSVGVGVVLLGLGAAVVAGVVVTERREREEPAPAAED